MKNSNLFTIPLTLTFLLLAGNALALDTETVTVIPATTMQKIEPIQPPHMKAKVLDPEGVEPKDLKIEMAKLLTGAAKHSALGAFLKELNGGEGLTPEDQAKLDEVVKNVFIDLKPDSLKAKSGEKQPDKEPAAEVVE